VDRKTLFPVPSGEDGGAVVDENSRSIRSCKEKEEDRGSGKGEKKKGEERKGTTSRLKEKGNQFLSKEKRKTFLLNTKKEKEEQPASRRCPKEGGTGEKGQSSLFFIKERRPSSGQRREGTYCQN